MSGVARPFDTFTLWLERRSRRRFPLTLTVKYKLLGKLKRYGSGKTCNISSTGVLIEVADQQNLSGSIELIMSWPCMLDDACALKLVVKGRVVRIEGRHVAVASSQYQFRTAGPASDAKRTDLRLLVFHP
jgi:hypothetical protein